MFSFVGHILSSSGYVYPFNNFISFLVSEMVAEEERAGIPSNRVLIGGFSQGGALALYAALTLEKPLAGAMALSSWLPLANDFPKVYSF